MFCKDMADKSLNVYRRDLAEYTAKYGEEALKAQARRRKKPKAGEKEEGGAKEEEEANPPKKLQHLKKIKKETSSTFKSKSARSAADEKDSTDDDDTKAPVKLHLPIEATPHCAASSSVPFAANVQSARGAALSSQYFAPRLGLESLVGNAGASAASSSSAPSFPGSHGIYGFRQGHILNSLEMQQLEMMERYPLIGRLGLGGNGPNLMGNHIQRMASTSNGYPGDDAMLSYMQMFQMDYRTLLDTARRTVHPGLVNGHSDAQQRLAAMSNPSGPQQNHMSALLQMQGYAATPQSSSSLENSLHPSSSLMDKQRLFHRFLTRGHVTTELQMTTASPAVSGSTEVSGAGEVTTATSSSVSTQAVTTSDSAAVRAHTNLQSQLEQMHSRMPADTASKPLEGPSDAKKPEAKV
eukprot:scaffold364_cov224-Alexandrium_tamarense.AAC.10